MTSAPLKIYVYTVEGVGHMNACIGMAQALAERGHSVSFLFNDKMAGQFSKFGFEEILLAEKTPPKPTTDKEEETQVAEKPAENPLKEMGKMLLKTNFLGPASPIEKMKSQLEAGMDAFKDMYAPLPFLNIQIGVALKAGKPDLLIVDSFLVPPAILMASIPWMSLCSAQPLCILPKKGKLIPFGAGLPANSKPEDWGEIPQLVKRFQYEFFGGKVQDELNEQFNCKVDYALNEGETVCPMSPYLNIYGYPAELAYTDILPDLDNYVRVDAFLRKAPGVFELPKEVVQMPGAKLIYLSMGSMGSIDVSLMKRITGMLGKRPDKYKVIVSKGPLADEYELPANCWGESFLPQTHILPLVDLVITHGGNNTTTETFAFGKPMVAMALFGDQYDNAQRIDETGYGVRLEPYTCTEEQLFGAIDKLLNDQPLHQRLKKAAERMANSKSKELACQKIEEVVAKNRQK